MIANLAGRIDIRGIVVLAFGLRLEMLDLGFQNLNAAIDQYRRSKRSLAVNTPLVLFKNLFYKQVRRDFGCFAWAFHNAWE